tara:strand:+ start:1056 stop:1481 length:426 start_codon:yes stop_codon:yes gene_type:complete
MNIKWIKLFLRLALSLSFFSAVADRFGMWPTEISTWGSWEAFIAYTQLLNPWVPISLIPALGGLATAMEVIFAIALLLGFKTELFAKLSGLLLLIFALSMVFSTGFKGAFDYSVFSASAAAFALSIINTKFLELDSLLKKS